MHAQCAETEHAPESGEALPERPRVRAPIIAKILAMGVSSVYRLAKAGLIPSHSAGPKLKGVRFDLEEVKEALRRPVNGHKDARDRA